jgi:hypothetical protein
LVVDSTVDTARGFPHLDAEWDEGVAEEPFTAPPPSGQSMMAPIIGEGQGPS